MALRFASASRGGADSVQGPGLGGLCDLNVGTTAVSFDLSAWAGQYIEITCDGDDAFWRFAETTGATVDVTTEHATAATAESTGANIAGRIFDGQPKHVMVPTSTSGNVFLRIRAASGTITDLRVHRA
jgi:hypothetical protein